MRGSVLKRGSGWTVKIELDPDPATGRRRQKWHSGFKTRRDAERARVDLLSKLDRGAYVEPSRQTVGEFLEEWLTAAGPTVRPSTFDSYSRNLRLHVVPHIGTLRLTKLDAGVLNGLYAMLLTSGRCPPSRQGAGYSPAVLARARALRAEGRSLTATAETLRHELLEAAQLTKDTLASMLRRNPVNVEGEVSSARPAGLDRRTVAYIHTILHRALKDAVRWGRLARNPADASDPPRSAQKSGQASSWDGPTLRLFLEACLAEGDRHYPLWVLLATTGMRRGEALGLRWSDVDLDSGRMRVVQTVVQTRNSVSLGVPKTSQGRRSVSLDPMTVSVLRAHRVRMLEDRMLAGPDFEDRGLVFHHPDGSWLRPNSVSDAFLRRVARHGLPRLTLHGLRHTWATLALEDGVHPKVVQERLGHSTVAITLGIYSHVSPRLHDEAANQVARLMLPPA
jgi:integrase